MMLAVRACNVVGSPQPYPAPATKYTLIGTLTDESGLMSIGEYPSIVSGAESLLGEPVALFAFVGYLKAPRTVGHRR